MTAIGFTLATGGASLAQAQEVSNAANCTTADHCYGLVQWSHGNAAGAQLQLGVYKLNPITPASNFITAEFWIGFDPPANRPNDALWLEYGAIHGIWCNNNLSWFSALQRSVVPEDFTLTCHGAAAESNDKHLLHAEKSTSSSWNLYRNGPWVMGYANTPTGTYGFDVGQETTSNSAQGSMTGGRLRFKYESTGEWANGWASTNYPAGGDNPNGTPCYSMWVSKPNDMRARCNIAPTINTTPQAYPPQPILSPVEEAQRIAGILGVPTASLRSFEVVETTNKIAHQQIESNVEGDQAVEVIQMEGDFSGTVLPTPPHAKKPNGKVATLIFDKATGAMLSLRLTENRRVNLNNLGTVKQLQRG
ncbi:hypothetical protein ABZ897_42075 [Nonomuraea sp. NPDC046802]|uniref:hypothetical protein n=1 Tax=Nonomuraea sp. NPDC046802 TaxID=3154919 RepID=UPI0034000042